MPTNAEVMTFTSLVQDVKDYLERGDEADETVLRQIPRIINNTERMLANRFKILGYLGSFTSTMTTQENRIAKPQNWRSTASLNYGTGLTMNNRKTLRERPYEYMRGIYPNDLDYGQPEFYCDYDLEHWLVLRTPDQPYHFEAMVYYLPNLLDEHNEQNYLTKYAPFCLLYGVLVGLESFLRNDGRIGTWKALFQENFDAINAEDLRRMADRGMARTTT